MNELNDLQVSGEIVNRVANSNLQVFNLEDLYDPHERVVLDIKDQLYMGMILREKDFREFIKNHDFTQYKDKNVAITCSADAIVPTWAYMLLAAKLEGIAHYFVFGTLDDLERALYQKALSEVDWEKYANQKVVVKGCSKVKVPVYAYVEATRRLRAVAEKIMYGEPCSTVPIFKK
ncbi:MAG: DUF2480 family protein [Bacteroidia bacterium]|nr:DUF2480 family protein [Bacteroidia bacterium]